jgi:membrane protease YdiL (CAAX protease family)
MWLVGGAFVVWLVGVPVFLEQLQDPMIALARGWPGGPYAFMVTMAVLAPTGLVVMVLAWILRARLGSVLGWLCAVASAVLSGTAVIPLLAAGPEEDDSTVPSEFQRWLADAAPGASWWALGISFLTLFVWAGVVTRTVRGSLRGSGR